MVSGQQSRPNTYKPQKSDGGVMMFPEFAFKERLEMTMMGSSVARTIEAMIGSHAAT